MNIKQSAWTGMVPVDDTALYVSDTGGPGRPVVYLNGASWVPVQSTRPSSSALRTARVRSRTPSFARMLDV